MVRFVLDRGVGRSEQEHPLPRDCERAAGSIEESKPGMPAVRQRKNRVHAFAEPRQWSSPRIFEQPDAVDPRAGRIHDSSRADRQVLAGDAVDDGDRADGSHALDRCRAGVVEGHGPGAVRRANRAERQPRIVGRSLLHESAGEDRGRVEWDELRRVPAPEQPRPRSAEAGDRRVEGEGRDELCRLPRARALDREHEAERLNQVRGDPRSEHGPFPLELSDETYVSRCEIAKAAMDELRRRGRRRPAEVALVDQHNLEACRCRLVRNAASHDAASDDEQVSDLTLEPFECGRAPLDGLASHARPSGRRRPASRRALPRRAPGRAAGRRCRS